MGNCQTADVAAVMIQHPDGRLERVCWSLTASDVMAANPGYYVAVVSVVVVAATSHRRSYPGACSRVGRGSAAASSRSSDHKPVRYLKLLRPDDPLLVGNFYRLVSFEDVLKEFGSKRRIRLSKLLAKEEKRRRRPKAQDEDDDGGTENNVSSSEVVEDDDGNVAPRFGSGSGGQIDDNGGVGGSSIRMSRHVLWRPTLQTISEVSTS